MYSFCQQMGNSVSLKMSGKSAILMIPVGRVEGGGGGGAKGEGEEVKQRQRR